MKIELGMKVKDVVHQIEGIVDTYEEYIYGINRVSIQPPVKKDGEMQKGFMFDETLVKIIDEKILIDIPKTTSLWKLGDELVCKVTKEKGILTSIIHDLGGCVRCSITTGETIKNDKDKYILHRAFVVSQDQLELVEKKKIEPSKRSTGGPVSEKLNFNA